MCCQFTCCSVALNFGYRFSELHVGGICGSISWPHGEELLKVGSWVVCVWYHCLKVMHSFFSFIYILYIRIRRLPPSLCVLQFSTPYSL